jgi:phage shock protein PspC (stress-responsive transcriptional regulator)
MNKVITINLGGNAYQLEEGGYDALRAYLETATAQLADNPDRDEILSDIERAIADKFRALLASHKTVVEAKEVAAILGEMGPIDADSSEVREPGKSGASSGGGAGAAGEARAAAAQGGPPRRLYRIHEGAMISGVCNGIAAYTNIDPTFVRLGFVLLTIFWGTGLLVYVVMAFVVPEAHSPEEKAAASGMPATAQEFIRRAKAGYYDAMKNFPDRKARREWKRQFKREMRANADQWRHNWHNYWAEQMPVHPGMGFGLPLLSLLSGAATVVFFCALVSLLGTGALFGRPLPASLPVWGAVMLLFFAYSIFADPLKMARHTWYKWSGRPGWTWSIVFLLDATVWLAMTAVLVVLAIHFFPELRDAIHSVPPTFHQAADAIRDWWRQR